MEKVNLIIRMEIYNLMENGKIILQMVMEYLIMKMQKKNIKKEFLKKEILSKKIKKKYQKMKMLLKKIKNNIFFIFIYMY